MIEAANARFRLRIQPVDANVFSMDKWMSREGVIVSVRSAWICLQKTF
jgi:hypothetical protein